MKYIKRIPKTDPSMRDYYLKAGWKKLKEPQNMWISIVTSIPLMVVCAAICIYEIYLLKPTLFAFFSNDSIVFTIKLGYLILLLVVLYIYTFLHEIIHIICVPHFRKSTKTYWGVRLRFGFAYTAEIMGKCRFILVSVMPYILLSLVAPIIFSLVGLLNGITTTLFVVNAAGSCVDFLNIILVSTQVPRNGEIVSNGSETYFKIG